MAYGQGRHSILFGSFEKRLVSFFFVLGLNADSNCPRCSLGAAFETKHHPDFVTFPRSLADFFADRAKALLEIELDAPCVATTQAMVVTSCHDMGRTRDARGWLYSGMSIRLAFDLALHKDMTEYVAKGIITQAEADLRRTVFWGAYVVDQ